MRPFILIFVIFVIQGLTACVHLCNNMLYQTEQAQLADVCLTGTDGTVECFTIREYMLLLENSRVPDYGCKLAHISLEILDDNNYRCRWRT
jgi:hypothetical protein